MKRFTSRALFLAVVVSMAGCGEGAPDTPFVSEAQAAPAQASDYGWKTNANPTEDGAVMNYE